LPQRACARRGPRHRLSAMPRRRLPLSHVLGPLEAEVMAIIWAGDEVTVREVFEELVATRPIAYTTVMTTMSRLADKGLLLRKEEQPAHRYSALLTREQYEKSTVKSVVDWLVSQFRDPAVAYFLDRVERGDEEIIESLREAVRQRESRRKKDL
jgi:BlaI family transcriptional regulator, penicillinase repressor